ncbi:flagellar basal-body rod protein FlgG [Buchnera aphidicola (Chaitoregma tattakana)]|uniref:flagellar basal-body rod protein FlgG n=1 Tax=Buchnera aphidicola TaxID=9 RepID=UPI0031B87F9B
MMPSMWIAKTGLDAQQNNMNVISNNLANVNTNGFKKSRAVFEDLVYKANNCKNEEYNGEENLDNYYDAGAGAGAKTIEIQKNFSQGNLLKTDSSQDIAINGDGFFQIQMPDGSLAYTRNGSFQINKNRQLVNHNGLLVQPNITLPENFTEIYINKNGEVSVKLKDSKEKVSIGQIGLAIFSNNYGLKSIGQNLYKETQISGKAIEVEPGIYDVGELQQGYLETSNVNIAEELINMIQTQRAYEINSKSINASDKMLQKICEL